MSHSLTFVDGSYRCDDCEQLFDSRRARFQTPPCDILQRHLRDENEQQ
jgi:Zn finger protein HypA/HybF involved in hydrogenase expression